MSRRGRFSNQRKRITDYPRSYGTFDYNCSNCGGLGKLPYLVGASGDNTCPRCHGTGKEKRAGYEPPPLHTKPGVVREPCKTCEGKGFYVLAVDPFQQRVRCEKCNASGVTPISNEYKYTVTAMNKFSQPIVTNLPTPPPQEMIVSPKVYEDLKKLLEEKTDLKVISGGVADQLIKHTAEQTDKLYKETKKMFSEGIIVSPHVKDDKMYFINPPSDRSYDNDMFKRQYLAKFGDDDEDT